MGADRLRVLVLALVSLGLIVGSALFLDWFVVDLGGLGSLMGISELTIDLRAAHACRSDGVCGSAPISMAGLYGTMSTVTLWTSLAFALLIVVQAGARLITDQVNESLSKGGYLLGIAVIMAAGSTAYFFQPEVLGPSVGAFGELGSASIDRTWGPALMLLGAVAGIVTLYYSIARDDLASVTPYQPVLAEARALPQRVGAEAARLKSQPLPNTEPERPSSQAIPRPEVLRGKLQFATLAAEVTRGGLDARREDGSTALVIWRDVVGVVARRLPPVYEGATFVDVVSTAGSTLRILPWTRLTGELVAGDGELRARAFVELVKLHCPDAKLDPATRAFLESQGQAAQLPDVETLAAHDERLA